MGVIYLYNHIPISNLLGQSQPLLLFLQEFWLLPSQQFIWHITAKLTREMKNCYQDQSHQQLNARLKDVIMELLKS